MTTISGRTEASLSECLRPARSDFDRADDARIRRGLVREAANLRSPELGAAALGAVHELIPIPFFERALMGTAGSVGVHKNDRTVRFRLADCDDTDSLAHEFAHLVHMTHGWDITVESRNRSASYDGGFYRYGGPADLYHLTTTGPDFVGRTDNDPALDRLAEAVNAAFTRIYAANAARARDHLDALNFGRDYAGANAAETLAVMHENLSSDDPALVRAALRSAREHGIVEAYLDVFRPTRTLAGLLRSDELAA